MTIVGCLPVDWAQEIQLSDDSCRLEVEYLLHSFLNFYFVYLRGSKRVNAYADRIGIADGIGELNFTPIGQTRRYHVLSNVPAHIRRRSIYFRRIFTRKRAATVSAHSAVGVDNNFSSGQSRIAFRTTDDESTGRIDQVSRVGINPLRRHNLPDHSLNDSLANFLMFYFRRVLGRDDHGINADRTKPIVFDRHLGFRIRPKPRQFATLAQPRQFASQFMAELDRRWHQFGSFFYGETEHQSLVAGPLFIGLLAVSRFSIDALSNVAGLTTQRLNHQTSLSVEKRSIVSVSDFPNCRSDLLDVVEPRVGRNFAGDDDQISFGKGFTSDPATWVLGKAGIQDSVGDSIADFVWMTFSYRFGREDITTRHRVGWYGQRYIEATMRGSSVY